METINEMHPVITKKVHSCHGCCKNIPIWNKAKSGTYKNDWEIYSVWICSECMEYEEKYPECKTVDSNEEWIQPWYVNCHKENIY